MKKQRPRLGAVSLVLAVPAMAVLTLLVISDHLAGGAALVAALGVWGALALLVRPYLRDMADSLDWIMAQTGDDTPPAAAPSLRRERPWGRVVWAVMRMRREWQMRQAQLADTARWNESLFDNLPDPLLLLDGDRRITRVNRAASLVFGPALAGRELAAALRHPGILEAADLVLSKGQGSELEFTMPVPVERSFRVRVDVLDDRAGDGTRAVIALHDITQVKKIENMRADFVANASHELRTPLATLSGFIETLRGPAKDDPDAQDRFLAIMQDQAGRMARLINDLLSLSRIELNEHTPPASQVDLAQVVSKTAQALEPLAAAKSIIIELDLQPDAALVVGQDDELVQLAQNLIDNAVKYGHRDTKVRVCLDRPDRLPAAAGAALRQGAVRLSVTDQGDGIAKDHLPRLTERFYRVDTARSRTLGGTGLGLAIVKHILNRHRGVLSIQSQVGRGSTFSAYLPSADLSQADGVPISGQGPSAAGQSLGGRRL